MQKMPDSRDVPPKILGGLYRAGVAELQQHIIRIIMMSTKITRLYLVSGNIGVVICMQDCTVDILTGIHPQPLMLLLDLFIYLNFEQKQQATHHRQFVDIYNLHGKNIAPAVPFYTAWHHT